MPKKPQKSSGKKSLKKAKAAKLKKTTNASENVGTMAITDGSMKDVFRDAFLKRPI